MSHKLKEVILELEKAKNLIRYQQKEIDRLKRMAVSTIVDKHSDEWWQGVKDFNESFPKTLFKEDK